MRFRNSIARQTVATGSTPLIFTRYLRNIVSQCSTYGSTASEDRSD